jgi:RNA polymerase sigma factor (TIGR02999 family)
MPSSDNITELLTDWNNGDRTACDKLIPLVENELRRIAHMYLYGERRNHTLQATALINEAYIKLVDQKNVQWQNRAHFFGIAAQLMRRILVDYARTQKAAKRGGNQNRLSLEEIDYLFEQQDKDLIALDDALKSLAAIDEQKSRIIELRFFAGLTIEETAKVLDISCDAVNEQWKIAKAWLYREINHKDTKRD